MNDRVALRVPNLPAVGNLKRVRPIPRKLAVGEGLAGFLTRLKSASRNEGGLLKRNSHFLIPFVWVADSSVSECQSDRRLTAFRRLLGHSQDCQGHDTSVVVREADTVRGVVVQVDTDQAGKRSPVAVLVLPQVAVALNLIAYRQRTGVVGADDESVCLAHCISLCLGWLVLTPRKPPSLSARGQGN
jgi:hypothetical protein